MQCIKNKSFWACCFAVALGASVIAGCAFGSVNVSFVNVAKTFLAVWSHQPLADVQVAMSNGTIFTMPYATLTQIVMDLRLPRTLLAVASGFGLALAGTVFQGVLRNPLADPFTLGVSSGAACGAALAISLGASAIAHGFGIPLFAFVGALLSLLVVLVLGGISRGLQRESLVLAGIVVSAFLAAVISLIKALDESSVTGIVFWVMGSFQGRGWAELALMAPGLLVGVSVIFCLHREVDILALGDTAATHLGLSSANHRLILLVAASAITAGCVAVSGIIGFVGLVVPHVCRLVWGAEQKILLPASACVGAILLVWADIGARCLLPGGIELPVGVITALLGGPFFCYLLYRQVAGKAGSNVCLGSLWCEQVTAKLALVLSPYAGPCAAGTEALPANTPSAWVPPTAPGTPYVYVNSLRVRYGKNSHLAVHDASFTISQGEWVGILGPNGSGKSSLLRCLAGVQQPESGSACIVGRNVQDYAARERALYVATLPQSLEFVPQVSVFSLVLMGRYAHTPFLGSYSPADHAAAYTALQQTGVAHLACRLAPTLSGGELQRVLLAQCMAQHAPVLLLDEATKGLDPTYQVGVLSTLTLQQRAHNITVVAAMHDLNLASQYCHRLIVMQKGRIVADGSVAEVFVPSVLEAVYETPMTFVAHPQTGKPQVLFLAGGS